MDPKVLAETIVGILADKLAPVVKVEPEELARLLAEKFNTKGVALNVAGLLLPDLHRVVDEATQKFAAILKGQAETNEVVSKVLTDCVERVALGNFR